LNVGHEQEIRKCRWDSVWWRFRLTTRVPHILTVPKDTDDLVKVSFSVFSCMTIFPHRRVTLSRHLLHAYIIQATLTSFHG
jgi:hypothetical protein